MIMIMTSRPVVYMYKKDLLQQYKNIEGCLTTCNQGVEDSIPEIEALPIVKKAKASFKVAL